MSQAESQICAFLARADYEQAATAILRSYADEILGYLVSSLQDRELAREAFAMFADDLWRGLPKVQLEASARAWAYAVARNASRRLLDRIVRKRWRELPVSAIEAQGLAVAETRPSTPAYLLTENKQRLSRLRERLSAEEQEILTLRIDRRFEFSEIAVAMGADGETLATAASRYRKRFQLIKKKLAKWLREEAPTRGD